MLIYERKSKKNLSIFPDICTDTDVGTQIDYRSVDKYVPKWIEDIVNTDNKNFLVDS